MKMKILARKIVRRAARLPVAGRFVSLAVALYRLPEMRQEHLALVGKPDTDTAPPPAAGQPAPPGVADLRIRQRALDNLVQSVPLALREMRRELNAMQRPAGHAASGSAQAVEARVLAPEKLAAPGAAGFRLNLAYGGAVHDGYLNVDRIARPGIDILAEPETLPLAPGSVGEIRACHLLEGYTNEALRERILPACLQLLEPGGRLCVRATDAGAAIAAYAAGECGDDVLRGLLYGGHDGGSRRVNMLTPASLASLLGDAGFDSPAVAPVCDGARYAFDITAARPGAAGAAS